ncbi:MAG: hypothetical protein ACLT8E_09575 [Akkermansia sp.]
MQGPSGARLTRGLGSGGDASVGAQAACESESSILRALEGSALTVLAAGLGGGTGSGVAPEVARLARSRALRRQRRHPPLPV